MPGQTPAIPKICPDNRVLSSPYINWGPAPGFRELKVWQRTTYFEAEVLECIFSKIQFYKSRDRLVSATENWDKWVWIPSRKTKYEWLAASTFTFHQNHRNSPSKRHTAFADWPLLWLIHYQSRKSSGEACVSDRNHQPFLHSHL